MPVLTPSCLPLSRRRRRHFLYSSRVIPLLVPDKLVSNHSTSVASQVAIIIMVKNLPDDAEDIRDEGLIPGSGRPLGEGHGNPLQYSCLENPTDRGARQGCNAWVHKESNTTEVTEHVFHSMESIVELQAGE